ncbi:phosphate ABC transporter substrate-binding protein [Pseudobacteroides cellulosolvens]|uniref:Phosphate-binding protein n=1 Tax=Pseudobacteroides cellulosolvens ATCC 35603 = DSM 2933 TaxID=398512 RepID=A0A0L6JPE7_9FIRM|nr:phosphate ABC transporter substrate-binding protein [Pseudobacteroides cellulosolvens]KNY27663.1 phosphate binding protein [Pseudobacteroides cellulosolvens ATCC 35603 = DSM 2933]
MKKSTWFKKTSLIVLMVSILSIMLSACGSSNGGVISISGSSALLPLADNAAKEYMAKNSGSKITVNAGGSGQGLTQVYQGAVNIGNSDVYAEEKLKPEEAKELNDHIVCVVGIAAVVNPNVKVDNITSQQLIDIFTGKITNWKDVGGEDKKIVLINRPSNSGTRATFKKYALNGAEEAEGTALKEDQSGTVKQTVSQTDGSISYLAFSYLDDKTKALKLNGVEPTSENVASGSYPVWAYEHMYTKGEPTGLAKSFIDYMLSDDVQTNIVPKLKFIPIKDMKVKR